MNSCQSSSYSSSSSSSKVWSAGQRDRSVSRIGSPDNSYLLGETRFFENEDEDDLQELVPTVSKRAFLVSFGRFGVSGGQLLSLLLVDRRDHECDLAFWGVGSEVFPNC
jgi:hypothetical protein